MPIDPQKSIFWTCCSELICKGCVYANVTTNKHDKVKAKRCPFCREPADDEEETRKRVMKRIKANDPAAMTHLGRKYYKEGNYESALEYWTKAAELGNLNAHYRLALAYRDGKGVEKDEKKAVYYWEKAAIDGHPLARYDLACYEGRTGNTKRAVRHLIIAANLGDEYSMKVLWAEFKDGNITKEDLDATLRSHQDALNSMKSAHRDAADVAFHGLR